LKTVTMPWWVALCMVLMTVSMSVYTVSSAILQYTLVKPFVMDIAVAGSKLTVDGFSLTYDPQTNRYTNCTVQVHNYGSGSLAGMVYVTLYNGTKFNIASGQCNGSFIGVRTVTIPLVWAGGKTAVEVIGGRVSVQQT